tara:strand:- start:5681 stop:7063 length:1383 start_codon:yes stop_codon:yes gene_type:complete
MQNSLNKVWVIDDDESIRWVLEKGLTQSKLEVITFSNADAALKLLKKETPSAILSDIKMPGKSGLELLEIMQSEYSKIPIIIMTAHSDLESATSSFEKGAWDYLPKPFDIEHAIETVQRAIVQESHIESSIEIGSEIIGEAPAMQDVFRAIGKLSNSHSTVLLTGETGTGKELVARALFQHSPRKKEPFIGLNMADIPKDLLEDELFGHEKGAFTGADEKRLGRFEQANNGTLFLDEIGDMPLETQTRLLRVLSNGEFYRVGGHKPISINVRVIAATHQNLTKQVSEGTFREDLFHRLNVIKIDLPKLNQRQEDIPSLSKHFLKASSIEMDTEAKYLSKETEDHFKGLLWPGNVRQLENTCKWLTVMSPSREIRLEDLPKELLEETSIQEEKWTDSLNSWADSLLLSGNQDILRDALPMFEKTMIKAALNRTKGRKNEAAKLLGWGRNTLSRKIKELDIL